MRAFSLSRCGRPLSTWTPWRGAPAPTRPAAAVPVLQAQLTE